MGFSVGYASYINAVCYIITVFVPVALIAWNSERKNKFILRCIICAIIALIIMEAFTVVIQYIFSSVPSLQWCIIYIQLIKFFVIFILSGVAVKVCFKSDVWGALFCATAGYCLQHISAKISSVFEDFVYPNLHWGIKTFLSMAVAAVVFTVFYFVIIRKSKKKSMLDVDNKWQVAISSCVVGVNIFYNSFGISYLSVIKMSMETAGLDISYVNNLLLFIYIVSMLTAVLALSLALGLSDNKRLSGEMQELERIMDEGSRQYEYEKNNIEMINLKCHDLKHQLAAMKGKIYEEQIEELQNVVEIYDSSLKTGNEALDVVLTQKNFYCSQHGIRLTCLINGGNYNFIARHELYTLFNNALDNAIEAVEKLPEERRIISVTEQTAKGFVSVRFENYFDGQAQYKEGLPVTLKSGEGHGYGIKSIKMIAEKYGGGISVASSEDTFTLDIFFENEK